MSSEPIEERRPVSADETQAIIDEWVRLQLEQAGSAAFVSIVAEEGFLLQAPLADQRWEGPAGLEEHQTLKRFFFDEELVVRDVRVAPGEERTLAWTCTSWAASYRPVGSPRSFSVRAYIEHEWELRRCPRTGCPFLQRLTTDLFEYRKGHAPPQAVPGNPYLDPELPVQRR